ncbi:MAG TPA: hypothetical protein VI980_11960 [Acidimicrobiia bacterium]|nr:hypothetical protein [Acidimicrobiia bacterium]
MSMHLLALIGHDFGLRWHGAGLRWIAVLMFLGFLAVLVVGVVLLWRYGASSSAGSLPRMDEALTTIRMRYARGEMTRQEFLEANESLGGPPPPPPPSPPS